MFSVITIICELIIMVLLKSIDGTPATDSFVILLIVVFSIVFISEITNSRKIDGLNTPLVIGYLYRLVFLFLDLYGKSIVKLPNSGADSEMFFHQGVAYSQHLIEPTSYFIKLIGAMFSIIGTSRLYVQFLLMLFSIISLYMTARILVLLKVSYRSGMKVMYILCLLPNLAILSSIFLRESVVSMFASISLYLFIKWYKGYSNNYLVLSILSVLFGSLFHSGIVGLIMGYVLAIILVNRKNETINASLKGTVLAFFIIVGFLFIYNNYSEIFFQKMLGVSSVEQVANVNSDGGSSYAQYVGNSNSVVNMVKYTPIRMIMFQFSPFVWQIRGVQDIIAMVFDSFFFIYVFYKTIKQVRIRNSKDRAIITILFIIGLATSFVFAWGVTNTGTALRHRNKITFIYAILMALSLDSKRTKDNGGSCYYID